MMILLRQLVDRTAGGAVSPTDSDIINFDIITTRLARTTIVIIKSTSTSA